MLDTALARLAHNKDEKLNSRDRKFTFSDFALVDEKLQLP